MLLGAKQFFERRGAPAWTNPYVTDGLIAMWDGEWNAGGGVHDASATTWKDLVGSSGWTLASGMSFGDDYITGDNSDNAYGSLTTSDSSVFGSGANNVYVEFCIHSNSTVSGARGIFAGPTTADTNAISYLSRQILGNRQGIEWASAGSVFAGTFGIGLATIVNGTPFASGYPKYNTSNGYNSIQSYAMLFKYRPQVQGSSDILLHSLRIYSRALTAAEISANYAIDKARFNLP